MVYGFELLCLRWSVRGERRLSGAWRKCVRSTRITIRRDNVVGRAEYVEVVRSWTSLTLFSIGARYYNSVAARFTKVNTEVTNG